MAVRFLAFNQIYAVGYFTIKILVYLPLHLIDFERFNLSNIWAGWTVFPTFLHTSYISWRIGFWIWGNLSPNKVISNVPLPPKRCKRWLSKYLTEIGVLTHHRPPVLSLNGLDGWQSGIVGKGKHWSLFIFSFLFYKHLFVRFWILIDN